MALRSEELTIHDRFTIAELRTYVRSSRGSMSGSPHDDRVMALALANEMRQYAFMPEYTTIQDDYWTLDWFARLVKPEETSEMQIGKHSMRGTL